MSFSGPVRGLKFKVWNFKVWIDFNSYDKPEEDVRGPLDCMTSRHDATLNFSQNDQIGFQQKNLSTKLSLETHLSFGFDRELPRIVRRLAEDEAMRLHKIESWLQIIFIQVLNFFGLPVVWTRLQSRNSESKWLRSSADREKRPKRANQSFFFAQSLWSKSQSIVQRKRMRRQISGFAGKLVS